MADINCYKYVRTLYATKMVKINVVEYAGREYVEKRVSEPFYSAEVTSLRRLRGDENIVELAVADCGRIIMEYMESTLAEWIGVAKNYEKDIMRQILGAVCYCHAAGIIHRDIKPANIFTNFIEGADITQAGRFNVKLGDFDYSTDFGNCFHPRLLPASSIGYRAPEAIAGGHYDEKVDEWATGCVYYEIIREQPLFKTADENYLRQLHNEFKIHNFAGSREILDGLLAIDPQRRTPAGGLYWHKYWL